MILVREELQNLLDLSAVILAALFELKQRIQIFIECQLFDEEVEISPIHDGAYFLGCKSQPAPIQSFEYIEANLEVAFIGQ
ncbi:hypothetical protein AQJ27_22630 [Streptomyces olivochromogenes]|nr:hypothetical protein AQJ27_22630 [Streptomyces olivochromogenes]